MTNLLLLALCYAVLLIAHPYLHAWMIESRGLWPNHALHALYATLAAGIVAWLFFGFTHYVLYAVAVYLFVFRWTVHDLALNLLRNIWREEIGLPALAFNYTGEIDGKDAWTDKLPGFKEYQYLYKSGLAFATVGVIIFVELKYF